MLVLIVVVVVVVFVVVVADFVALEGIIQAPRSNLAWRMHMVFGVIYFEI